MTAYEIERIEWDDDLGGLIVYVNINGGSYQLQQQYILDDDDDIVADNADCWSWIDDVNIYGEGKRVDILKKFPWFEEENRYAAADRAWDLFAEIMSEAVDVYQAEKRIIEILVEDGYINKEDAEHDTRFGTIQRLYETDMLTQNKARNGRKALWYLEPDDSKNEAAIYIDTLEELSGEEIEEQLV